MNPHQDTATPEPATEAAKPEPRSIADGIPVGDGRIPTGNTIIAGKRKSGKTVLLRTIINERAGCGDAITWVATPTGLHSAAYLAGPFQTGHALDRLNTVPLIDWLATTSDEVTAMLDYAGVVAEHRRIAAVPAMLDAADTEMQPSPAWPNLTVVVDDADQLTPHQMGAAVYLARTGRAVCVDVVLAVPDLAVGIVPSALSKNVRTVVFTSPVDNPFPTVRDASSSFAPNACGECLIVADVDTHSPTATTATNTALRSADIRRGFGAGKQPARPALNLGEFSAAPDGYQRRHESGSGAILNALIRDTDRATGEQA